MKGKCRVCKRWKKMKFRWADNICKKCFNKETAQRQTKITILRGYRDERETN